MKGKAPHSRYYRRLGLDADPFPVTGIDEVLYLTPELENRLKRVREHLRDDPAVLILSAPRGAGKSRLSHHLESALDGHWLTGRVQAREAMRPPDLAAALLAAWSAGRETDTDDPVIRLHQFLEETAINDRIPVAVIDDAHCLSSSCLELVFELARVRHGDSAFRFVLLAEDGIDDRLYESGLTDKPDATACLRIPLPALSETQTGEYIRHRILSYGEIRNDPFTEETLRHIYYGSGGLPGGIHYLAREAVQNAPASNRTGKAAALTAVVVLGAAAYALVPQGGVFIGTEPSVRDSSSVPEPGPAAAGEASRTKRKPPNLLAVDNSAADPGATGALPVAWNRDSAASNRETPDAAATTEDTGEATATRSTEPAVNEPETAQAQQAQTAMETERRTGGPDNNPGGAGETDAKPATAPPPAAPSPLTQPEEPPDPAAPRQSHVFDLKEAQSWTGDIHGEDWLRSRPADSVLLQIISASELGNVRKLADRFREQSGALSGFTNYTPSGRPRYRLYYGLYPDPDQAAQAVAELPEELRKLQPWPRPLADIIEELDEKQRRFSGSQ